MQDVRGMARLMDEQSTATGTQNSDGGVMAIATSAKARAGA
jgi:hypothetical protein